MIRTRRKESHDQDLRDLLSKNKDISPPLPPHRPRCTHQTGNLVPKRDRSQSADLRVSCLCCLLLGLFSPFNTKHLPTSTPSVDQQFVLV